MNERGWVIGFIVAITVGVPLMYIISSAILSR